jgi:hypothetical protein
MRDHRKNGGAAENPACPQVPLPGDYQTCPAESRGRGTRRNCHRCTERRTDGGGLHLIVADNVSPERDPGILPDIWRQRRRQTPYPSPHPVGRYCRCRLWFTLGQFSN